MQRQRNEPQTQLMLGVYHPETERKTHGADEKWTDIIRRHIPAGHQIGNVLVCMWGLRKSPNVFCSFAEYVFAWIIITRALVPTQKLPASWILCAAWKIPNYILHEAATGQPVLRKRRFWSPPLTKDSLRENKLKNTASLKFFVVLSWDPNFTAGVYSMWSYIFFKLIIKIRISSTLVYIFLQQLFWVKHKMRFPASALHKVKGGHEYTLQVKDPQPATRTPR